MAYNIVLGRGETDKKIFGERGLINIGKGFVRMGQYTSLSNKIFMDIARSHVVLVAGKRGSGKSYTLGVFAEELSNLPKEVNQNLSSLIFDTMGIYWTMKFQNQKDKELLSQWGLKSKNLPVRIFVPSGHFDSYLEKGIPVDERFALSTSEMNAEDWILTFNLDITHPISVLIERTITKLKDTGEYYIKDIIEQVEKDEKSSKEIKDSVNSLFEAASTWGIFAKSGETPTQIEALTPRATTSVLDLSVYNSVGAFNIRALVISLVSRKIF
ncbi:ATP-binding protein, partial [Patescibacteria group bacterium]|nr:ATP-binding protein [Patescibacteria group bacterium]